MDENIVQLFIIKELIPFYSIAFAVNMAFGFWDSLREIHVNNFDEMANEKNQSFENALKINNIKPNESNSCRDDFKKIVKDKKKSLDMISNVGKFFCGIMCLILAFLIAYVGMYPDTSWSFQFTLLSILGSALPFSLMMLASFLYCKKSLSDINNSTNNQIKGMISLIRNLSDNYQTPSDLT